MIKNPLVSYYGDFDSRPYTEEYGAHTSLDVKKLLLSMLITALISAFLPTVHPTNTGAANDTENGNRNRMMMSAVMSVLMWLLLQLFNKHASRTTIQKGFLYYLGWQHILCWSSETIGIKSLWMNVYDSEVESSTNIGVWSGNNVAWLKDNPQGITAHIDDDQMFGGWDEGGGFIGDVRFYFGGYAQPKDPWMIAQMTNSENIPQELKGLTPKYPMYFTVVIPKAYIGKQATIPEMWFEVINYPNWLGQNTYVYRLYRFRERLNKSWLKFKNFLNKQSQTLIAIHSAKDNLDTSVATWISENDSNRTIQLSDLLTEINNINGLFDPNDVYYAESASADMVYLCNHGVWTLEPLGEDLNPAEAIFEILTNTVWGCHYETERIDINSLVDVGIVCEEEELGISMLMDNISQARDYINKIMTHINAVHFDNPTTGKLTFKCIRNDFDLDTLKVFNVSNCQDMEFTRVDWSEIISSVSAKFTDADTQKYTTSEVFVYDMASRLITKSYTTNSVDASYFTTSANARFMAQTQLMSLGYPLAAVSFNCNRYAHEVLVGEPILINWEPYGISKQVYRVTNVDYATLTNGLIKITAVEDIFSFDKTQYAYSDIPQWLEPEHYPWEIARWLFLEMPYELTLTLDTYISAWAAQPSNYTIYWDIWRYIESSSNYDMTNKSSKWSMVGRMVYGYQESFATDQEGFEFSAEGVNGHQDIDDKINKITANSQTYNNKSTMNLCIVDGEIMSYNTIEKLPNGNYQMTGIMRGLFDTVPKIHTTESILFFIDYYLNVNGSVPAVLEGETKEEQLELTSETRTKAQDFDVANLEFFNTTRRAEQPSIMAYLKMAADRGVKTEYTHYINTQLPLAGDILFTFIGRNKFNNYSILEQSDDKTGVEVATSTKNVIRTLCNRKDFEWLYDATKVKSSSATIDIVCIGDSLTYATGGWTWVTTTAGGLIIQNITTTNFSQPIMNVSTALTVFNNSILPMRPSACLIWIGIDDLWDADSSSYDNVVKDYTELVNRCINNDIIPIICISEFTDQQIDQMYNIAWQGNTSNTVQDIVLYLNRFNNFCSNLAYSRDLNIISPITAIEISPGVINPSMVGSDLFHLSYAGATTIGTFMLGVIEPILTSINITNMRYKWEDFCHDMGDNVSITNVVELEIKTYDEDRKLYSYDKYDKVFEYNMPRLIGIVEDEQSAQTYANSLVNVSDIVIPSSAYIEQFTITYHDCGLIVVGTEINDTNYVKGQDGKYYQLSTEAYRVVGTINGSEAILYKIELGENYILRSNFSSNVNNTTTCWQYINGEWKVYISY